MMSPAERSDVIRERLETALSPELIEIEDDSASHAGHEGAKAGGGHFNLTVVAAAFEGKSPIERHRMVYDAMGEMMQHEIHALSIKARVPD